MFRLPLDAELCVDIFVHVNKTEIEFGKKEIYHVEPHFLFAVEDPYPKGNCTFMLTVLLFSSLVLEAPKTAEYSYLVCLV